MILCRREEKKQRHKFYIWIELFYRCVTLCVPFFFSIFELNRVQTPGSNSNLSYDIRIFTVAINCRYLLQSSILPIFNLFELVLCACLLYFFISLFNLSLGLYLFVTPFRLCSLCISFIAAVLGSFLSAFNVCVCVPKIDSKH